MADSSYLARKRVRAPGITMGEGKSPQGRKSFLIDRQIFNRLRDALAAGNTYQNACAMAGIGRTTFYRWLEESEKAPEGHPLREFRDMVLKACAIAEHRNLMAIQKAAPRHWQAAAWFLERRNPHKYGRREVVTVGGDLNGVPVLTGQLSEKSLSDEGTMAALAAVLKRRAPHLIGA
jgi:hypothetical protein